MSGRSRFWASSLLVVLFTGLNLGVCAVALSGAGGKLPCCADAAVTEASFTACCTTGQPPAPSDLPVIIQTHLPPASEIAFAFTQQTSPIDVARGRSFADIPHSSADPQALLSTFLI